MPNNSRNLIKAMMVIGGAQAIKILISISRMKILAILLGPTGVGLLSIYNSLQEMVTVAAGLGMESSGIRQIASAKGASQDISRVRWVLIAAHLAQGTIAMSILWLFRRPISEWLFGNHEYTTEVGLIGISVLLALFGAAQTALLQGMRRITDLGRLTALSALISTAAGIAAVWFFGEHGLIWIVILQPLATVMIGLRYTNRLPIHSGHRPSLAEIFGVWKPMAKLGAAFMLGALATAATLLLVRSLITQELGLEAAGQFAASWGITMTYIGFLLRAMAADYYPRLAEITNDRPAASQLINDQIQLGLAVGGPVLLLLIGLAPWVITLLYNDKFQPAAILLQWQTVGNVFRLAAWPLIFSFVAASKSKTFVLAQISFNTAFLALVWLLLPDIGLQATALAFLVGNAFHFGLVSILANVTHRFRWQKLSLFILTVHLTSALVLLSLARTAPQTAAFASVSLAAITAILGLHIVLKKAGTKGGITTAYKHFSSKKTR